MTDLYSLAYISKNAINGDGDKINAEITKILACSRENNIARGVTGALLYSGGYFCQVLEGPEQVLEELFEIIEMDDRHSDVVVLHFEPIEARGFNEWAMALAGIEGDMCFDIEGILSSKDELKTKEAGRHLVGVLEQIVNQHQSVLSSSN